MGDQSDLEKLSFEDAYSQLESIVRSLDSGRGGLEEALDEYEKGMALVKEINSRIDKVEKQMIILEGQEDE